MTQIGHRVVRVNGLDLHVAEAGPADGPLVVLLHGFPEFWFEWREQIGPLAAAGFHVVAPDQRGYNLSGKPKGAREYRLDLLAADVLALADSYGRATFSLVGHDWGASVAWWTATLHPERLERLVVLNAPHPAIWRRSMLEDPVQRKKSRYVQMIRLPWLAEALLGSGNFRRLAAAFDSANRREAFGPEIMAQYRAAWAQPGALTGALNWYRALFQQDLPVPAPHSIPTPTLVMWGDQDVFAGPELAELSAALCADARVIHLADASHWVVHDKSEAVRDALLGFLKS